MLAGDLTTMPLADVLQWVDARGSRARIAVRRPDGAETWMMADARMIVAGARPIANGRLASDGRGLSALAREQLLDLFLATEGTFELREGAAPPGPAVELELAVQFLVMEGLRLLDERPRLDAAYPRDEARLGATDATAPALDAIDAEIVELAHEAPALGEARLVLGISRPALLRRVEGLRRRGLVDVEGIPHGPDVEGSLIEQAQKLLAARQYPEAAHVFRSLLATSPADARVRVLLAEAERLHLAAHYARWSRTDVVSLAGDAGGAKLVGTEVALLDALARPRALAVLVLLSPLRELETLTALARLEARGVVTIESAE